MPRIIMILICSALGACGPVQQAATHAADAAETMGDAIDEAVDIAQAWVDTPQLEQRKQRCHHEHGEWVAAIDVSACDAGRVVLQIGDESHTQACDSGVGGTFEWQCLHRTADDAVYFNDGPSHPTWMQAVTATLDVPWDIGRWNSLFWDAAVNHDYCYHHNGISRGFDQKACDEQMLSDLSAICLQTRFATITWFDRDVCKRHAAAMFAAVRGFGDAAWDTMNTAVDYPLWQPRWQAYGMAADCIDAELVQQVEMMRQRISDMGISQQ